MLGVYMTTDITAKKRGWIDLRVCVIGGGVEGVEGHVASGGTVVLEADIDLTSAPIYTSFWRSVLESTSLNNLSSTKLNIQYFQI